MLFLLQARLTKPAGMSNQEFYGIWSQEAEVAMQALHAGAVQALYKVAGQPAIVAIVDVDTADAMDQALHQMPIWQQGYSHLVTDITWTPLRPYGNWTAELQELAKPR